MHSKHLSVAFAVASLCAIALIVIATHPGVNTVGDATKGRPTKCGNLVCNKGETAGTCAADCACATAGNGAKTWLANNACCSGLYNSNGVCCPTNTVWNSATQTCETPVTPPSDATPPIISNGAPSGTLPAGTTSTTLSVNTNEQAVCKYSTTPGTPYASMQNTFAAAGQTHTTTVTGLSGTTYNYYVRCMDASNNANTQDYTITFTVTASCTDITWTPDAISKCGTVTQTSNCGKTRTVQGSITCSTGQTCTNNQCSSASTSVTLNAANSVVGGATATTPLTATTTGTVLGVTFGLQSGPGVSTPEDMLPEVTTPSATNTYTFSWNLNPQYTPAGTYQVYARARLSNGAIVTSALKAITVTQAPTTPVCGNSVQETGEQCDTGAQRGACPAMCSTTCTTNNCSGAPAISGAQPTGTLAAGTTTTTMRVTTSQAATCKYGTNAGVAYPSMPNTFTTTGGTTHSTSLSRLVDGNSYTYFVRCSSNGAANTQDYVVSFNIGSAGGLVAQKIMGSHYITAGYTSYFDVESVVSTGGAFTFNIDNLPPGATVRFLNSERTIASMISDRATNTVSATGRLNTGVTLSMPATVAPGSYPITLRTTVNGVPYTKQETIVVRALQTLPKQSFTAAPALSGLARYENSMITFGQKHCDNALINSPSNIGADASSFYYDGERIYYQIGDYTKDSKWKTTCAQYVEANNKAYISGANGWVLGNKVFPHGLSIDYKQTGDTASRDAAILLADTSSIRYFDTNGDYNPAGSREMAYALEAMLVAQGYGKTSSSQGINYAENEKIGVDIQLGYIDQWFIQKDYFLQPFMQGLTAEALIREYEKTGDPRIPPAIALMADELWTRTWVPSANAFMYLDRTVEGEGGTNPAPDLNGLILPMYGWLYKQTGDTKWRDHGDLIFNGLPAANVDTGSTYLPKQFNEQYRMSMVYLQWRQGNNVPLGWPSET